MTKVLVTGGSGGIGNSIVSNFRSAGFDVTAPDHSQLNLLTMTSSDIDWKFDIVVNCAGVNVPLPFDSSDKFESELQTTLQINLLAPAHIISNCLPYMISKQHGRIINIGSIWSDFAKVNRSAYSMSKAGLHSLTKSIAVEYGRYNILCNTISPGFVDTPLTAANNTEREIVELIKSVPLGRLALPHEISKLVYQLTVENTFVTGQNIVIDGGYSCSA